MKRLSYIVEPGGEYKKCKDCGGTLFVLTRGTSQKALNKERTVFSASSRYIYTCVCGCKEYATIYGPRLQYTNEADFERYQESQVA